MTVSTHKGNAHASSTTINEDKGTILNGGNISGTAFQSKSPQESAQGRKLAGSMVIASTGTAYKSGIATANSSGTLAYNPNAPSVTRSSSDTGFVIRSGVANKISGVAGLNPILSGGSDTTSRRGGNIHVQLKYRQAGTWATAIFDVFGGGLLQSDGTAKAGITNRGGTITLANDNAAQPTRAIPGEMVLLFNFVSFTTNQLDYSAITLG